jgi:hypothetical protein
VCQCRGTCYFVGTVVENIGAPGAFQADDEGSIPFTRSNLSVTHLLAIRPSRSSIRKQRRSSADVSTCDLELADLYDGHLEIGCGPARAARQTFSITNV